MVKKVVPKTFFPIYTSLTFAFTRRLSSVDMQDIFKQLAVNDLFDGVKSIDDNLQKGIKLYSSDNMYRLTANKSEVVFAYINYAFIGNLDEPMLKIRDTMLQISEMLSAKVDFATYRIANMSLVKKDKQTFIAKLFNPAIPFKQIDDINVDFNLTKDDQNEEVYVKVTTSHTTSMHRAVEANGFESRLKDSTIVVDTLVSSEVRGDDKRLEEFLSKAMNQVATARILEGIGYGTE